MGVLRSRCGLGESTDGGAKHKVKERNEGAQRDCAFWDFLFFLRFFYLFWGGGDHALLCHPMPHTPKPAAPALNYQNSLLFAAAPAPAPASVLPPPALIRARKTCSDALARPTARRKAKKKRSASCQAACASRKRSVAWWGVGACRGTVGEEGCQTQYKSITTRHLSLYSKSSSTHARLSHRAAGPCRTASPPFP